MTLLNDAARALLESDALVHLATTNPDGSPQVSVVWAGLEDDEIVIGHLGAGRKVANLERDPRVALTIEAPGANPVGMTDYLMVHGTARITPGGAPELLQRLAHVYVGPDSKFPPMDDPPPGHVIRIRPDRVGGHGPWTT